MKIGISKKGVINIVLIAPFKLELFEMVDRDVGYRYVAIGSQC